MTISYLTKAGLKAREKQIQHCTRPMVDPRDEGRGEYSLTSSMFTLCRGDDRQPSIMEPKNTHEYARKPTLAMDSTRPIPIQSIEVVQGSKIPVVSSRPLRAMILSAGRAMKVNGQIPMQILYILAGLNRRRSVGIKNSWRDVAMAPAVASEYPIWDT